MKTLLWKIAFVALALIAIAGAAAAYYNEGMVIDTDNFYFETYNESNYGYELTATPYQYSYNDWLYFDDSFRVHYYDTYYNYQSGWYNFSPSYWRYDPYAYSYYGNDYYFYNNAWNYYPGWTAVYGPIYYGSYYYPSFTNYYSYPSYAQPVVVAPTYNVGAPFNYPQEAFCSQIYISASNVTLNAGESMDVEVRLSNNSPKDFKIESVDLYIDSFDVAYSNLRFDSSAPSGFAGIVRFSLDADEDAATDSAGVQIRVNGQFSDGTNCRGEQLSDNFNVNVIRGNRPSTATNFVEATTPNRSTSTIVPRGWVDVPAQPTAQPVQQPEPSQPTHIEGTCNGLDIVEKNLSVNAGETLNTDVYIKNFTSEDFAIDYVTVKESEDFFAATANIVDGKIYSGDYGVMKLSIAADDFAKERTGSAILTVRGHLEGSGKTCTTAASILVHVKGEEAVFSGGFGLDVPQSIELNGNSGTFTIKAANTTNETAKVWFDSESMVISPAFITVPANSTVEKILSINAFSANDGRIFYRTELPGFSIPEKYSKVTRKTPSVDGTAALSLVSYTSRRK